MDNRNRDKMSRESTGSTSAGNVNRSTSEQRGKLNSDSSASYGQNIGRSEKMNEPSGRRGSSEESGWNSSSSGRSGVSGSKPESSSTGSKSGRDLDIESDVDRSSHGSSGTKGSSGSSGSSGRP